MITSAFAYVTVLLFLAAGLKVLVANSKFKIFEFLPAIVLLYFSVMVLSTLGFWQQTESINQAYSLLKTNLLPAMIFLMLLQSDIGQIKKLGGKIIFAFFAAAISIGIAFVIGFTLFQPWLVEGSWKTLAALSGSWMGGTGNMAAIQMALDVPPASMGYTLLIDSIDYALWVMLLLALVPYAKRFAQWTGADTRLLENIGSSLADAKTSEESVVNNNETDKTTPFLLLLSLSLLVSVGSQALASLMPTTAFFTQTTWVVSIVTVLGVVAAQTRLKRVEGSIELSNIMLYLIIGLIASRADFAELTQAPTYILLGLVILFFHGLMMVIFAKVFKFDLFTCGIASLANIGGVASAPILAAAYSRALIPVGVLMAMLGYIVGTGGGLLVGKLLSMIAV
ncbi:DUF819 family protein [Paraglaciecola aquimarina]|uniref:DUF819 family protein n=1 Tax=Paraglaciecola algarum TaxID=3050085 RepID=A0ABS9D1L6_9ALTE|nr:DUF819 family protein [Paraglaciecola sp. G1-23]MCF2946797.1 DUF819 family protein [Paraglaciecola sp. G1-23]